MKTKKVLSTVLFCSCAFFALAQVDYAQTNKGERVKKWQLGANFNTVEPITEAGFAAYVGQLRLFDPAEHKKEKSFCIGLDLSYRVRDNITIRLSAKETEYIIDETWNSKDQIPFTGNNQMVDGGHIRESVLAVSPAILWDVNYKKIKIYGGFKIEYKKYSPLKTHLSYSLYNLSTNTIQMITVYDFNNDGGFSIGTGPVAGFTVCLFKGISVGAEFGSCFSYYKTGDKIHMSKTMTYVNPSSPPLTEKYSTQATYQGCKFSSILSSIIISIDF